MPSPTAPAPRRLVFWALLAAVTTAGALTLLVPLPQRVAAMNAWRHSPPCTAASPSPTTACVRVEDAQVLSHGRGEVGKSVQNTVEVLAPVAGRHALSLGYPAWSSAVSAGSVPVLTWGTAITVVLAPTGPEETTESPRIEAEGRVSALALCAWVSMSSWLLVRVHWRRLRDVGPADLATRVIVVSRMGSPGAQVVRLGWLVAAAMAGAFALAAHDAWASAASLLAGALALVVGFGLWASRERLILDRDGIHHIDGRRSGFTPWGAVGGIERVVVHGRGRSRRWQLRCHPGPPVPLQEFVAATNAGDEIAPTVAAYAGRRTHAVRPPT